MSYVAYAASFGCTLEAFEALLLCTLLLWMSFGVRGSRNPIWPGHSTPAVPSRVTLTRPNLRCAFLRDLLFVFA